MTATISNVEGKGSSVTARLDLDDGSPAQAHECDGCGGITPDVDLWAQNHETGEEVWFCEACAEG